MASMRLERRLAGCLRRCEPPRKASKRGRSDAGGTWAQPAHSQDPPIAGRTSSVEPRRPRPLARRRIGAVFFDADARRGPGPPRVPQMAFLSVGTRPRRDRLTCAHGPCRPARLRAGVWLAGPGASHAALPTASAAVADRGENPLRMCGWLLAHGSGRADFSGADIQVRPEDDNSPGRFKPERMPGSLPARREPGRRE